MKRDNDPRPDNRRCEQMIRESYHGVLVMCRGSEPYAVPMNHGYENGKLYFHCAPSGMKLDFIRKNPSVAYVIQSYWGTPQDLKKNMRCHGRWESVVVYGNARVFEEPDQLRRAFRSFMSFYGRADYEPSAESMRETRAIVVDVVKMTARREFDENRTEFWTWEKP